MQTKILTQKDIQEAAQILQNGGLVAFPTETVYGLGAPIFQPKCIAKIFQAKKRPQDNPLIAHVASLSDCEKLAKELPPLFFQLAECFFPGPLTLIVKKREEVPEIATASLKTIAIRMPNHPLAQALITQVKEPLVAPSANLSGRPSSTTAEHVLADFDGKIAAVIDAGVCEYGMESTVVDLVSFEKPTLLRAGSLPKEAIEAILGMDLALYSHGPKSAPGMKYRHYAPEIPVHLFSKWDLFEAYLQGRKNAFVLSSRPLAIQYYFLESKTLYAHLRLAEKKGYDEVIIFCQDCADAALVNRLEKITHASNHH